MIKGANFLKNIRIKLHPVFVFSQQKEIYSQLSSYRVTKHRENRDLVEEIFFPEYRKAAQMENAKKLLQEKSRAGDSSLQITEGEFNKLNEKKKDGFVQNREELFELILKTNVNDKLIKFPLWYSGFFGQKEWKFLLKKLNWTFLNQENIQKEEIEKFEKKRAILQNMLPNADLKFSQIFLKKEQVFQNPIWISLIESNENKIREGKYTIVDSILFCHHYLCFSEKKFPISLFNELNKVISSFFFI